MTRSKFTTENGGVAHVQRGNRTTYAQQRSREIVQDSRNNLFRTHDDVRGQFQSLRDQVEVLERCIVAMEQINERTFARYAPTTPGPRATAFESAAKASAYEKAFAAREAAHEVVMKAQRIGERLELTIQLAPRTDLLSMKQRQRLLRAFDQPTTTAEEHGAPEPLERIEPNHAAHRQRRPRKTQVAPPSRATSRAPVGGGTGYVWSGIRSRTKMLFTGNGPRPSNAHHPPSTSKLVVV